MGAVPTANPAPVPATPVPPVLETTARRAWLDEQTVRLVDLALATRTRGGFGWSDGRGALVEREVQLWLTARATHVLALGHLMGRPGCAAGVTHGVAALTGPFRDGEHGGWFSSLTPDGLAPAETRKAAYAHAFVVLAASSATVAGVEGARELLDDALVLHRERFLDEGGGVVHESYDRAFGQEEDYRGANAAMHTVEAYLAAADVTGEDAWRQRALAIAETMIHDHAAAHGWRVPEHFTAGMVPLLDFNVEAKADPFRPFGVTPGHGLEWARLLLSLRAGLGEGAPAWLAEAAGGLADRACSDAWAPDGHEGFVYTTGFDGEPVVDLRLHWVVCEAVGAAAALFRATGEQRWAQEYERWWAYAQRVFVDDADGSWAHELDAAGHVSTVLWDGRPDTYHALQATVVGRLPDAPSFATALAQRAGEG